MAFGRSAFLWFSFSGRAVASALIKKLISFYSSNLVYFPIGKYILVYFLVKKIWFTFPGKAVAIKAFWVYFLVRNFGLLLQGPLVVIEKNYLVYFLVKEVWFTFAGRAV